VSTRSLVTVAVVVWSVALLVAVLLGLPTLLTVAGVHVDAGLIVNALAAAAALAAAVIAFQAVGRQIKANAENVTRQINAQADAIAKQITSDRAERRRAERIPLIYDALAVISELAACALLYALWTGVMGGPVKPELADEQKQRFREVKTMSIRQKLDFVGLSPAAEAVQAVWKQAQLVIAPSPLEQRADSSTVEEALERAGDLLRAALSESVLS
jgi:hypothetical protein